MAGLSLLLASTALQAATVRYVNVNSTNPVPPFTDWSTAATTIQDAVDAAVAGDEIVVTNGVYQTGATAVYGMSNRVAVTFPVTVRSVNGPAVTQIVGYQVPGVRNGPAAVRCAYLTNGAVLAGFTLTNGATQTSEFNERIASGGGVWCEGASAVISNCVFTGNSANYDGGGAYSGTLNNCVLTGNSASWGGGASEGTLNNCTLTGNSASSGGGGLFYSTLNNCIIYYNSARTADANYYNSTFAYSCTTPGPAGTGNLVEEPQLASASHLSAVSPCRRRGSAAYATGVDVDGEPWASPPAIGCDEYWSGSVTGALNVAMVAAHTNVAVGFGVDFQALIGGRVSASRWDFGDGVVVSNRPWTAHAWTAAGDYVVELRAYNESYLAGVAATVTVHVIQEEHYVALTSVNPLPPYSSWATAATNIQDAADAAELAGALVWVSNGVYQSGARELYGMSNRLAVTKPIMVRSVSGPAVTHIMGYQEPGTTNGPAAVRCAYLTNGAILTGFTLAHGATQTTWGDYRSASGGGVWCEGLDAVVSNCVFTGNSASYSGGGAYWGTLNNCTLTGNSAVGGGGASWSTLNNCTLTGNSAGSGGGVAWGTLNNCTLKGNSAAGGGGAWYAALNNCTLTGNSARTDGGGTYECMLKNCIVFYNSASYGANYFGGFYAGFTFSCTTPLPWGAGNLTNAPLFVDTNGWSSLRLQSNSPCINAGNNTYAPGDTDFDDRPRIVGGRVDLGAYEFQGPGMGEFIGWLSQYSLPIDGSADFSDSDGDWANNWQEWRSATDPTNTLSALRLLTPQTVGTNLVVSWQSAANKTYLLERSPGLNSNTSFLPLVSNLIGQSGTTAFTDTNTSAGPRFYRVGVQ